MKADASPIRRVLAGLGVEYQQRRAQYSARCPAHTDGNASLAVSVNDSGTVGLHCHAGCDIADVLSVLGMTTADLFPGKTATKSKTTPARRTKSPKPRKPSATAEPLPQDQWAEAREQAKRLGGGGFSGLKVEAVYLYRHANGKVWGWRARFIDKAGKKHIKPFHHDGVDWVLKEAKAPRAGKPLYRLPDIVAAEGQVYVVEGEKCADALAAVEIAATTSGAAKSASKADWSPLAGRDCVIWPDNDDPGEQYAADVGEILQGLGCKVRIIDLQAAGLYKDGADAVDWLDANPTATAADVLGLPTIEPAHTGVMLTPASAIAPKAVDWLWGGYLACGMLTLIAGNGGTGKTTIALSLAAIISRGGTWPDRTGAPKGSVIIWSGEDAIAEILVPRLLAAGADLSRIHFVTNENEVFDPATDMPALEHAARRITDLALVIVDPIVSMVQGDSHKNAEVRRGLQPVLNLAADTGAAVIGITHYAKNTAGRTTAERVIGSVAFNAVARTVLATAMGSDGEGRIVRAKNNIGPTGDGFAYSIAVKFQDVGGCMTQVSGIEWGRPLYGFADELLGEIEAKRLPKDDAAEWLSAALHAGPVASKELKERAEADGFAWRTVERAKESLAVIATRQGEPGKRGAGAWVWKMPSNKAIKSWHA